MNSSVDKLLIDLDRSGLKSGSKILIINNFFWDLHTRTAYELIFRLQNFFCICYYPVMLFNYDVAYTSFNNFIYFRSNLRGLFHLLKVIKKNIFNLFQFAVIIGFSEKRERNLAKKFAIELEGCKTIEDISKLCFKGVNIGHGVASSVVDLNKGISVDIFKLKKEIYHYLYGSALMYQICCRKITDIKPDAVFIFNGRLANAFAMRLAAEQERIPVYYYEVTDSLSRFRLDRLSPHNLKWWNREIMEAWERVGNRSDAVLIGRSYYEKRMGGKFAEGKNHASRFQKGLIPDFNKANRVCYFSQSDEEYSYVLDLNNHLFKDQREAVTWLISYFKDRNDVEFFIRIHPNLLLKNINDIKWWLSLSRYSHVQLIPPESNIDSYELIKNVDKVITYHTASCAVEACYLGTPSIILGDSAYISSDASYHPDSVSELRYYLNSDIPPKEQKNALPYGFFRETYGYEYTHVHNSIKEY